MSEAAVVLEAEGLTVRVDGRTLFTALDLRLAPGEVVAIVGPNGSGKTTLLNAFSGLVAPAAGVVRVYGNRTRGRSPAAIATMRGGGIARSFQVPFLQDEFDAWTNVQLGERIAHTAGFRGNAFAIRVREVMESLGVARLGAAPAGTLSLGQRRRLELARVFATGARVILLDEPFANLDDAGVQAVGGWLREGAGRGAGVVVVEHREEAITRFCDRRFATSGLT